MSVFILIFEFDRLYCENIVVVSLPRISPSTLKISRVGLSTAIESEATTLAISGHTLSKTAIN